MERQKTMRFNTIRLGRAIGGLFVSLGVSTALAQTGQQACGNPFRNHFGPFDFRTVAPETRKMVEDFHFTPGIQSMTQPRNTMMRDMAKDVAYTLEVFPNHPRALLVMHRLSLRWKSDPAPGTSLTVECWFDRAIRFRPDDTVVRSLYAQYLGGVNRRQDAAAQLKLASEHAKDNPLAHYNIGLVAMEAGLTDLALQQAHRARALGFPRQELVEQLRKANAWVDPPALPASSNASAAPSASEPALPDPTLR
jgi:hypothetical protein